MNKVSVKKVFNALKRIGVGGDVLSDSTPFKYPINNFNITLSELEDIHKANPAFTNYDLINLILERVIGRNTRNYLALQECYRLIGQYAQQNNINGYQKNFELAIYYHLRWKLEYGYGMIISNRGCCQCSSLDGICAKSSDIIYEIPLLAQKCEFGMCTSTAVSLSERQYLKRSKS